MTPKASSLDSTSTKSSIMPIKDNATPTTEKEVSSNISNFNPSNQSFSLSVWNKENGNLAFLNLGKYISQDSFEIEGYVTNRNKNERLYISKLYSLRDFNQVYFEKIDSTNVYQIKKEPIKSIEKDTPRFGFEDAPKIGFEKELILKELHSYSIANGNIKSYRGIYSENNAEYEFIAQTDPIPLLIIIVGVAMASSATTYLLVNGSNDNYLIVENSQEYSECVTNGGKARIELVSNNLFSRDEYSFKSCELY